MSIFWHLVIRQICDMLNYANTVRMRDISSKLYNTKITNKIFLRRITKKKKFISHIQYCLLKKLFKIMLIRKIRYWRGRINTRGETLYTYIRHRYIRECEHIQFPYNCIIFLYGNRFLLRYFLSNKSWEVKLRRLLFVQIQSTEIVVDSISRRSIYYFRRHGPQDVAHRVLLLKLTIKNLSFLTRRSCYFTNNIIVF